MKIGIREGMVPGMTLPEKLACLREVGLDGIELHGPSLAMPREELVSLFAESPVAVSCIEGIPMLIDADPAKRATAKEGIRARLDLAARLGAVGVLVVPQFGRQPALPDLSPYKSAHDLERELLISQLRELAPDAAAAGVSLFLEPLNRYEAYLVNRLDQGVAIAREAGPAVGVMADFFHMNIEERDIAASIRMAGHRVVYVHVADSNRLQPGRGHLDFRTGFAALKEAGYDGWLTIESRVDGPFDEAIRETAAFLREQWAEA